MKQVIHKTFFAWNFDKEEKWLNDMAANGLNLVDASLFRYVFEEGPPGEYQYRLEFLDNLPAHPESRQYLYFMEDMGVEHIASVARWVYFRKKITDEPFEIFSDIDSKIKHLTRLNTLFIALMLMEFGMGLSNLNNAFRIESVTVYILCGILFACGLLFASGVFKITRKINKLKKERDIHE